MKGNEFATFDDNEIVKAMEWCKIGECRECAKCVPNNNGKSCRDNLLDLALDLINRQKAEIERLQNAYKQCAWERDTFLEVQLTTAKTEAIKKFAERLKVQYMGYDNNVGAVGKLALHKDIENIVKEMVGD